MTLLQTGLARAATATGYQISRSLRFNSADSTSLTRTPAGAGSKTTWTYSTWFKRTKLTDSSTPILFGSMYSSVQNRANFTADDKLEFIAYSGSFVFNLKTTQVFRDVGAHCHLLLVVDSTNATASDRIRMYINGSRITVFDTATYPSQNADCLWNGANAHQIGSGNAASYFDGYMADSRFIDGQALTPSSFGETDSATGVWVPKAYTGTYGTNGFWLKFDDNSGVTATTLGKDSSGNGNNWTPNNFSVTAGVGNDSLVDSPTNYGTDTGVGGEVRGNYATLNPITASFNTNITFTEGNLRVTKANSTHDWRCFATMALPSSGKWFWEWTIVSFGAGDGTLAFGLADQQYISGTYGQYASNPRQYQHNGNKYSPAGGSVAYGASFTTNDVIGVAYDADNGTLTFYKNGTSQGTAFTGLNTGIEWYPWMTQTGNPSNGSYYANFGQRPFAYTAPSGFKALCTTNLSTPAIGASASTLANKYFDAALYTGTGSSLSITSLNFQPDFVWIKGRSGATDHALYDAVRGVQLDLVSNSTAVETTQSQGVTAFGSTGFTVGTLAKLNTSTATYVAWNWYAGGSNATNTSGTITSTVRANTASGISVVTYTGNGTAGATVGHGLGVAPRMILTKARTGTNDWGGYHVSIGNTGSIFLSNTVAVNTNIVFWNNTSPTSAVFSLGTNNVCNTSTVPYVAYCFAEIVGFSKFGSYTGNGSADGTFVYCGFRPRYVMYKRTDTTGNWITYDSVRSTYNQPAAALYPNLSNAEDTSHPCDILSNGFKLRSTGADSNASGGTYIFAAFAESPFNYSRAR